MSDSDRPPSVVVHRHHDFAERLAYSQTLSDEGDWEAFYRRIWPDYVMCARVDAHSDWQRAGVDRCIWLPNGRQILVDEKKREKDYGDLLIEEWSVWHSETSTKNKIGWSLDPTKRCDFVAYAIPSAHKCYLLPFELTRLTCAHNLEHWKAIRLKDGRAAYPKAAANNGYKTINVAVEWGEFKRALNEQIMRRFAEGRVDIPIPRGVNGDQLDLLWPSESAGAEVSR